MRCIVGVEFSTDDGRPLITTYSNDRGQFDPLPVGDSIFECRIAPNPLMPGKYSVRAGIADYAWSSLDLVDPEMRLEVANIASRPDQISLRRSGLIALPLERAKVN